MRKSKRKITPAFENDLWNLLCWVGMLAPDVTLKGVECADNEIVLENHRIGFIYNFRLGDQKAVKGASKLCCLWANRGVSCRKDYSNRDIFHLSDYIKIMEA